MNSATHTNTENQTGPTASSTVIGTTSGSAPEKLPKLIHFGRGIFACSGCCGAWSPLIQFGGRMPADIGAARTAACCTPANESTSRPALVARSRRRGHDNAGRDTHKEQ